MPSLPELQESDLIFQTSLSNQSKAIAIATASLYTHMGILKKRGDGWVVIETAGKVQETSLDAWIDRGLWNRIAIYRDEKLTVKQRQTILAKAQHYYGKLYDVYFSFDNDAYYCSELPYLSYEAVGVTLGKIQTVVSLNVDNAIVRRLVERRWKNDPDCKENASDFAQCYQRILERQLVTPASIAGDAKLTEIYSNYHF